MLTWTSTLDLTNLVGAILGGLIPTVIALAIYFCISDAVLIAQCLYYKYIRTRKDENQASAQAKDDARQPLLQRVDSDIGLPGSRRRSSTSQARQHSSFTSLDLPTIAEDDSGNQTWFTNAVCMLLVCLIGAVGWAIAWRAGLW